MERISLSIIPGDFGNRSGSTEDGGSTASFLSDVSLPFCTSLVGNSLSAVVVAPSLACQKFTAFHFVQ
jgi:hypothetical protein